MPGMSMSMGLSQQMEISQKMELAQRMTIAQKMTLRLALLQELTRTKYTPHGVCPSCGRQLTLAEILKGFNRDPNDFTTICTGCGRRFEPKLRADRTDAGYAEVGFYCPTQTLAQLRGSEHLPPAELRTKYAAVYHSALVHFGGLRQAFSQNGVSYTFDDVPEWKEKIVPFLGQMPDSEIAKVVGVSPAMIGKMRRARKIPRFSATVTEA